MDDAIWNLISRHVGWRDGRGLRPVRTADGEPLRFDAGDPERPFLIVAPTASEAPAARRMLRMEAADGDREEISLRQYRALVDERLPAEGTCGPDRDLAEPPVVPEVLPPLFYCRHKTLWIAVRCPSGASGEGDGETCAGCGKSRAEGCAVEGPLHALWQAVQEGARAHAQAPAGSQTDEAAFPPPACLSCERRTQCYPASGSPTAPAGALDALIQVQPRPWIGLVVRPVEGSLPEWVDALREATTANDRLVYPEFLARASAEDLWLRLEFFHRLLSSVQQLSRRSERPHGALGPEQIRLRHTDADAGPVPSSWKASPVLLDVAPGVEVGERVLPEQLRPKRTAAGAREPFGGVLTPLGETAEHDGRRGAKFLFLLDGEQPFREDTPAGTPLRASTLRDDAPVELDGVLESGDHDVLRVTLFPGAVDPDDFAAIGADVTLRIVEDGGVQDPDLFALGTLWIGLMRRGAFDVRAAAVLRDRLREEIERAKIDRVDHRSAARLCGRTALATHESLLELASADEAGSELELLGRCLWLGVRMTDGLTDAGERLLALDAFTREVGELIDRARFEMLGRPRPAEELLSVIEIVERELRKPRI